MNQANVTALEAILQEHAERSTELMQVLTLHDFAAFLASRGVLVPSALTDEALGSIYTVLESLITPSIDELRNSRIPNDEVRAALQRIARGDP